MVTFEEIHADSRRGFDILREHEAVPVPFVNHRFHVKRLAWRVVICKDQENLSIFAAMEFAIDCSVCEKFLKYLRSAPVPFINHGEYGNACIVAIIRERQETFAVEGEEMSCRRTERLDLRVIDKLGTIPFEDDRVQRIRVPVEVMRGDQVRVPTVGEVRQRPAADRR